MLLQQFQVKNVNVAFRFLNIILLLGKYVQKKKRSKYQSDLFILIHDLLFVKYEITSFIQPINSQPLLILIFPTSISKHRLQRAKKK